MTTPPTAPGPAARYDLAAMRPPEPGARFGEPDAAGLQALQRWCLAGSGPGGRPLWAPRALPCVQTRFALAYLTGSDHKVASQLALHLALERDGSLQLQACRSGLGRLGLRLKTKLHDMMWWRRRQPSDPWDSGCVRDTPAGLQALSRFRPRRATLLVAEGLAPTTLATVAQDLHERQLSFAHPVRLLVPAPLPDALCEALRSRTLGITPIAMPPERP